MPSMAPMGWRSATKPNSTSTHDKRHAPADPGPHKPVALPQKCATHATRVPVSKAMRGFRTKWKHRSPHPSVQSLRLWQTALRAYRKQYTVELASGPRDPTRLAHARGTAHYPCATGVWTRRGRSTTSSGYCRCYHGGRPPAGGPSDRLDDEPDVIGADESGEGPPHGNFCHGDRSWLAPTH